MSLGKMGRTPADVAVYWDYRSEVRICAAHSDPVCVSPHDLAIRTTLRVGAAGRGRHGRLADSTLESTFDWTQAYKKHC